MERVNSENRKAEKPYKFNKKEWRQRKYSKKYKVEKWEERRRKAVLHNYYKELRKSEGCSSERRQSIASSLHGHNNSVPRLSAYHEAQEEYKRKVEERAAKLQEAQKKKEERTQALARYKANKAEVFKKLSKKTKKGQPVMKDRIEMLLNKLQRDVK